MVIYQFGYPTLSSPPIALQVQSANGAPAFALGQNSGLLTNKNNNNNYIGSVTAVTPFLAVPFDTWVDIVVGVKWATDDTGEIRVYHRVRGKSSTWTLAITMSSLPTEQYGTT